MPAKRKYADTPAGDEERAAAKRASRRKFLATPRGAKMQAACADRYRGSALHKETAKALRDKPQHKNTRQAYFDRLAAAGMCRAGDGRPLGRGKLWCDDCLNATSVRRSDKTIDRYTPGTQAYNDMLERVKL